MTSSILATIKNCIRVGNFDLTRHAFDEMAEDELILLDVEKSVLSGKIVKVESDDPNGPKYTIHGTGISPFQQVGSVGRFVSDDRYLIITVYAID